MDTDALLRAAAANHRSWFRRNALAAGGRVERAGAVDLTVAGGSATIAFPRTRQVQAAVERVRELGVREAGCWSLAPDPSPRHPPRRPRLRLGLAAALDGA